uniref:NXPE C-terminal domain-containing protein n=1 Tax=Labrus bergylta TaxID=56723 RepID=A0A3Q3GY37_9LABR
YLQRICVFAARFSLCICCGSLHLLLNVQRFCIFYFILRNLFDKPLSLADAKEERMLLDSIAWPETPPLPAPFLFDQTSDPAHSIFTILPGRGGVDRHVGDQLEVMIQIYDFQGNPKKSGGDVLLARLHNRALEAGVAGRVVDHLNGSYSAVFPLLWEGSAHVEVTLVHSSEAVTVLHRLYREHPERVLFKSLFRSGSSSETTYNVFFPPSKVNLKVFIHSSGPANVMVLPPMKGNGKSGLSGYYYQGVWRSLGGTKVHQFNNSSAISQCLKGKVVHMYGDSTLRQWFEYFDSIRRAVIRLLNRAPDTLVVIMTANLRGLTPSESLNYSDWYTLQLDKVLRAVFKGFNVRLVDAWEMTLAHHLPHNIHPGRPIVKNMIDILLSYICTK